MNAARLAAFAIAALPGLALADIYKCPNADGKVEYQDTPCTKIAGQKIDTKFNTVDTAPNPEVAKKVQEFDAQVNKRLQRDAIVRDQKAAAADAKYRECRDYDDQAARQAAWLKSQSAAVRASARAEIAIAERKWADAGCR